MTYIDHETGTEFHDTIAGVCKDCGNGTLNNELNPAFQYFEMDDADGIEQLRCALCGSAHLDIL